MGRQSTLQQQRRVEAAGQARRHFRVSGSGRTWVLVVAVAAAVIAAVVIVSLTTGTSTPTSSGVPRSAAPAGAAGTGIVVGEATAPAIVEVYEDYQCAACAAFERRAGSMLAALVADGTARISYQTLAALGEESVRAANAAACAADVGRFEAFHRQLFVSQPLEGTGGYTNEALLSAGRAVGLASSDYTRFAGCVEQMRYSGFVRRATESALQRVTATPTLFVNGNVVPVETMQDTGRLRSLIEAAAGH